MWWREASTRSEASVVGQTWGVANAIVAKAFVRLCEKASGGQPASERAGKAGMRCCRTVMEGRQSPGHGPRLSLRPVPSLHLWLLGDYRRVIDLAELSRLVACNLEIGIVDGV